MKKELITHDLVKQNAFFLAHEIYTSGFFPSIIYVSMRGGAALGNIISEYFKLSLPKNPPLYAAIVAHSYSDTKQSNNIVVEGWTYLPELLQETDKILLVDDIFDSGRTINKLCNIITSHSARVENIRIAVHDYKIRLYEQHQELSHFPHYYARKHVIDAPNLDSWIHYLSHEVEGLTDSEIEKNYPTQLHELLKNVLHRKTTQKNSSD